jgi:site-specific DNA recombinase
MTLRCALYARVSTEQQAEKFGLASQLRELRARASERGYTVVGEFIDDGVSGSTLERPRLNALRALVRARSLDIVLAHTSDRISRALVDYLLVVEEIRRHGARIEFVTHTPEDTAEGKLREQVLGAVAEFERAKIRERTGRGAREKARRGTKPTGAAAFGYRLDPRALGGLAVDPAEAAIVRQVFTWAADGVSIRSIAARLDAQGIRPRRAARWSRTSVRVLLQAELYLGRGVYNRRDETNASAGTTLRPEADWIRYAVPPIVSPALAEKARAQLRRNRSLLGGRPARRVYLVAGLAVCGACGRRMHGDSHNPTPVYRCEGRLLPAEDRCRFTMPASALERRVWDALAAVLRDPDVLRSSAKASQLGIDARRVDAATEHAELTRAAATVRQGRDRLVDLYVAGRIDKTAFDARERPLEAEAERLERALAEVEARRVAGQAEADRHAALVKYCRLVGRGLERLDDAGRQVLVRKLIRRVVLHPERVELEGAFQLAAAPPDPPAHRRPPGHTREKATGKLRAVRPSGASRGRPTATRPGRARGSFRSCPAQLTRRPRRSQRSQ